MKLNTDSVACWSLVIKTEKEKSTSVSMPILSLCYYCPFDDYGDTQSNSSTKIITFLLVQDKYLVITWHRKTCLTKKHGFANKKKNNLAFSVNVAKPKSYKIPTGSHD